MIQTRITQDQINGSGRTLEFYGDRDGFSHLQWEAWLLAQLDQRNLDFSEGRFFDHNLPMQQRLIILHEVVCKLKSDHVPTTFHSTTSHTILLQSVIRASPSLKPIPLESGPATTTGIYTVSSIPLPMLCPS
jgi:hypothetical protein